MKNIKRFFAHSFIIPVCILGIFLFAGEIKAAPAVEIKVIDGTGDTVKEYGAFSKYFSGEVSIASGDLGGDGIDEIVIGAESGKRPEIKIFRQDGSLIASFLAYPEGFKGGVNAAVGDLDADGVDEIITAPAKGGTSQIRVFDGRGNVKFTPGFLAYSENFNGGVNIAVGDVNSDGIDEIITAPASNGGPQVRVFDRYGNESGFFWAYESYFRGGVSIYSANVDGIAGDEILTGRQSGGDSRIKIFSQGKNLIKSFFAFSKNFNGGINISASDLDGDGVSEIIAAPASRGGPQVRIFNLSGKVLFSSFVGDDNFRGSINLSPLNLPSYGQGEEIIAALSESPDQSSGGEKRIDVDISDQVLKFYDGDKKIGEHRISTGKWSMPTPIGTFQIRNHVSIAYSRRYALYMDSWMAITPDGAYGLHSLPYWKTKNGVIYEGRDHIGKRVSHGCIRQLPEQSKILYSFAPNGTKVVIHE